MEASESSRNRGGAIKGRPKHRSPNYPLFDLGKAVERAKTLYDHDKSHKVPIATVHERWGYTKHSGAGNQAVAAVKAYGLVDVDGDGEKRMVAVSDLGRRIIIGAPNRKSLLKRAAVGPSLFNSLWLKYRDVGLPSDEVLRHYLIWDRKFNEDVVDNAISRFKDTVTFANLAAGDKIDGGGIEQEDDENSNDLDENQEVSSDEKPQKRRRLAVGSKEDVFTLEEGDVVLQWPKQISKASAQDLEDWLELIVRKAKRQAGQDQGDDDATQTVNKPNDESD